MKCIEVAAAIISNERGEVLLAQRPPGTHLAGFWEFPGGKLEAGEGAEAALIRELKEELELEVGKPSFIGLFPYRYEEFTVNLHVFTVGAECQPKPTHAVQVFKWIRPEAIDVQSLAPADVIPLVRFTALSGPLPQ